MLASYRCRRHHNSEPPLRLIDRASTSARFKLTALGHDVLAALIQRPVDEQDG